MAIDGTEQKRNVVRIRGIPAEMKENNRHLFAQDAAAHRSGGAASPNREILARWKAGDFTLLFSEDVLLEYVEKLIELGVPDEKLREFVRSVDDDVRIQNRADGGHQLCGAISSTTANNRRNISSREMPPAFMRSASTKPSLTMLRAFSL